MSNVVAVRDGDEILRRMHGDRDSDWPARVLHDIARVGNRHVELAPSEIRVLKCLSHGLREDDAAKVLGISPETVKRQTRAARMKLRAKNTTHAVSLAIRQGLIP